MNRNEKKYQIEKVLHELIRDLPQVRKISQSYERGLLPDYEALAEIAEVLKQERREK
jgi:hypothetical protein